MIKKKNTFTSPMQSVRYDDVSSCADLQWDLSSASLPLLPEIHSSLRNVLVIRELSTDTICSRISNFMWTNDIECQYNIRPGRATCCTPSLVKFYIQLWKRRQNGTNEILVEIQRLRGCTITMQRVRSAISRAILTGDYKINQSPRCSLTIPPTIKLLDKQRGNLKLNNDLEVCISLLESPRHDHKQLGMESLSILTDPLKVNPDDALFIATTLVCRNGRYGASFQNEIKDFLNSVEESRCDDDEESDTIFYALKAIENSLNIFIDDCKDIESGLPEALKRPSGKLAAYWNDVSDTLLSMVGKESKCPHHQKVIAIKILQDLAKLSLF